MHIIYPVKTTVYSFTYSCLKGFFVIIILLSQPVDAVHTAVFTDSSNTGICLHSRVEELIYANIVDLAKLFSVLDELAPVRYIYNTLQHVFNRWRLDVNAFLFVTHCAKPSGMLVLTHTLQTNKEAVFVSEMNSCSSKCCFVLCQICTESLYRV